MKQAFLIGAFQNPNYLLHLVNTLDSSRSNIYIHVNKYNEEEFKDFYSKIVERANIYVYSKIKVKYGSYKFLESSQFLLKEAYKNSDNTHFHFMSGQDILTKPIDELCDFFEENKNTSYFDCSEYPKDWDWRINKHHVGEIFPPNSFFNTIARSLVLRIEKNIKYDRKQLPFETLYIGSPWWSINRKAAKVLIDYFSIAKNWSRLKYTWGIEEVIVPTLLGNAIQIGNVVKHNQCYMNWSQSAGCHPNCLIESDYNDIVQSNRFFARKVDPIKSYKLIELIDNNIGYDRNR